MRPFYFLLVTAMLLTAALAAHAEDLSITIKGHKFTPDTLTVPANTRVKLTVKNQDATAEEFESKDFDVEKVIPGNSEAIVTIPPLDAGTYRFVGEYNEDTAKGTLVVK